MKNGISKRHKKWLEFAMNIAKNSDMHHKHGAVLVKGGSVLSFSENVNHNDPFFVSTPNKNHHAETRCIRKYKGSDVSGAVMYVARISNKDSRPMMSKPCENCQKVLKDSGIRKVFYTIDKEMDL